jgi:hypothetical protein
MYMGHVAVGIAAKRISRGTPVLALALATIAPDIGDIVLGIAGVAHSWYYTHTVPAAAAWAVAVGAIGLVLYGRSAGLILAALAATHVPLDYITSRIDVVPGGAHLGLGLYDRPPIDFALEAVVIGIGWWCYRSTVDEPRRNHWAVIAIPIVMVAFQATFNAIT